MLNILKCGFTIKRTEEKYKHRLYMMFMKCFYVIFAIHSQKRTNVTVYIVSQKLLPSTIAFSSKSQSTRSSNYNI